jgi:hypothetical protein
MANRILFDQIDEYIEKKMKTLVRAAVLETERRLKERSPVDTGRFRSNWQTVTEDFSGSVSNNLPYAERLADGWSKQAPAGWIDGTAKDIQTWVQQQAKD